MQFYRVSRFLREHVSQRCPANIIRRLSPSLGGRRNGGVAVFEQQQGDLLLADPHEKLSTCPNVGVRVSVQSFSEFTDLSHAEEEGGPRAILLLSQKY